MVIAGLLAAVMTAVSPANDKGDGAETKPQKHVPANTIDFRADLAKAGAKTRGIYNELIVKNFSRQWVRVFYNGRFIDKVAPLRDEFFHVHDDSPYFDLYGRGSLNSKWHHHEHGRYRNFTWRIHSLR